MAILRVRDIDGNLYDIPVIKGDPGYTPVKGEDYWTEEELEAVTAELLANARPSDWIPTAEDVGARPDTWMPTAAEVGATPASHANDKNNPHGVTAAQVGARPDTWLPTASEVGAAPSSHSHAASNITSGTLGVARGGTGKATHSANAVLTGNGSNAVNYVATANGALYATSANGAAKFGTLPVAQGGTGATNSATALANLGGVSTKLLWENARPTSPFDAQTVSLALSDYSQVLVYFRVYSGSGTYSEETFGVHGLVGNWCMATSNGETGYSPSQRAFQITNTGIKFSLAYYATSIGGSLSWSSNLLIPTKIYGIKGVS